MDHPLLDLVDDRIYRFVVVHHHVDVAAATTTGILRLGHRLLLRLPLAREYVQEGIEGGRLNGEAAHTEDTRYSLSFGHIIIIVGIVLARRNGLLFE